MSTTNGTKSLQKVQNAKHLFAMGSQIGKQLPKNHFIKK